ncbi:hypothetical protein SAMN05421505_12662 [Sinosporangium album]|uniref:Uncharacterized protein n=1 Tax=Sinosporangium album TaxID=504805 RepID=A0A1G8GBV8_9ACTN|nr:T3SS effector HopA1 family protein [Sinosporangium album]SDH91847.1 hypothetical protein SAMN05421505_12662 [Sinosporangium album]
MIHPDIPAAAELLAALPEDRYDLGEVLYAWYLASTPLPSRPAVPSPLDVNLGGALDAAHADATRFVGGWRAERATDLGGVIASRGGLLRHIPRAGYTVPARPGLPARPGDALLARVAWTWCDSDHGFWHTRRGPWPPPGADRLTRTYLNVTFDGVPAAIEVLTTMLAGHRDMPYQIKTPLSGAHGGRADAVVLYLGAPDAAALAGELPDAARRLAGVLRPACPRFTDPVAPGVGQAQGPLGGASFGQVRCDLLARTWRAAPPGVRRDAETLTSAIARGFADAGVDPARPYLLSDAEVHA